jgi:glycosyltransferase involved in cell wall biosynthesis
MTGDLEADSTTRGGERIRVLMVDSEETWRGGQAQVDLLMRGLRDRGFDVALAAPPTSVIARKIEELGFTVFPLPTSGGLDLSAVFRLRRLLGNHPFDIVHCHSSHAHGIAWLALAARRGLTGAGGRGPRLLVSRRVDFPVGARGTWGAKYRWGVDRYVAVSTGVRKVLVDCGVREERVDVVPDGIDLAKFLEVGDPRYLTEEFGLSPEHTVVGNVAALAPHKSQVDFIRAAKIIRKEIPRARFFVVGEGELRPKLEALVEESGLQGDVVLTGFRRDVLELLSLFDCFVLSSYLEGLCTSIMDAHAMGVPVVATRTGGVPDLVLDGETGLLVPPRNPELLAAAVVRMLRDDTLRARCIQRAREQARTYDYTRMVEGTIEAYRRVVAPASSGAARSVDKPHLRT